VFLSFPQAVAGAEAQAGILLNNKASNNGSSKVILEPSVQQDPRFRGDDKHFTELTSFSVAKPASIGRFCCVWRLFVW